MASLLDDACIHLARRAPAALIVLGLVAGCGGERPRTGGDTTATAVATPESAAMPVANPTPPARDTTAATTPDTGAKPPAPAAPSKPAAPAAAPSKPSPAAATPSKPAPTAAAPSKPTPAATRPAAPAETAGKGAAAPAATAAQQQDTSGPPAEAPLRDAYHQAPRDTVTQTVYNGWKQFNLNCARCHGEDVLGTTIAPHLIMSLKPNGPINTKELFVQTVCAGRPAKGMPAWCALGLDMNKINDIYQYVKGRSDAKIGPGRPAVKQEG